MLHPSTPHRAPAQLLSASPTNPRQQGPTGTAHAGDRDTPITPLVPMLCQAGIPAQKDAAVSQTVKGLQS